jgi:hypothetical protein
MGHWVVAPIDARTRGLDNVHRRRHHREHSVIRRQKLRKPSVIGLGCEQT